MFNLPRIRKRSRHFTPIVSWPKTGWIQKSGRGKCISTYSLTLTILSGITAPTARETLLEIYHEEGLEELDKFQAEEFVTTFTEINYRLWDELDKGIITKKIIREKRFEIVLEALGVLNPTLSRHLNERFIETCPTKSNVPDRAHEILTHLNDSYQMHIITNGFQEVQHIKMKSAKLDFVLSGNLHLRSSRCKEARSADF